MIKQKHNKTVYIRQLIILCNKKQIKKTLKECWKLKTFVSNPRVNLDSTFGNHKYSFIQFC